MRKLLLLLSKKKQMEYENNLGEQSGIVLSALPGVNKERAPLMLMLKALLMFLIVMGCIDAYMSGFSIDYDVMFIAAVVAVLSVVFTLAGTNIIVMALVYGVCAYLVSGFVNTQFDVVSSGVMAIINISYRLIRVKYNLPDVDGFDEAVTDRSVTIPTVLILGAVAAFMILSPFVCRFMNLMLVTLAVFLPLGAVLFFDGKPSVVSSAMLVSAWVLTALIKFSAKYGHIRGKRLMSPLYLGDKIYYRQMCDGTVMLQCALLVLVIAGIAAGMVSSVVSSADFDRNVGQSSLKKNADFIVRNTMIVAFSEYKNYVLDDFEGEGQLGMYGDIEPDFNTDLVIRMVPYTMNRIYFRSYIGSEYPYRGNMWLNKATEEAYTDKAAASATAKAAAQSGASVKVNIYNAAVPGWKGYMPYYTDLDENSNLKYTQDDVIQGSLSIGADEDIVYHPLKGNVSADISSDYRRYVYENYLEVPKELKLKIAALCSGEGFDAKDEQLDSKIINFFQKNYEYNMKSGRLPWNTDFVEYFLFENKKGVCAHFASSAVLMYRSLGIPARYVEGYCVDYDELTQDGNMLDDPADESWISGIKPLSENVMEAELSDYNAHAWVEVYRDNVGWVVVDPTPYITKEAAEQEAEEGSLLTDIADYFSNTRLIGIKLGRLAASLKYVCVWLTAVLLMLLSAAVLYIAVGRPLIGFAGRASAGYGGSGKRAVGLRYNYIRNLAVYCCGLDKGAFCRGLCEKLCELGMDKERADRLRLYTEKALYARDGVAAEEYKAVCALFKEARKIILKSAPIGRRLISFIAVTK
jgi:hypothetical protein